MASSSISAALQRLPGLQGMLLTDQEGVVLLHAAGENKLSDEHQAMLQRMAVTFAQTTERANKLGLGKNRHITAFYGAGPPSQLDGRISHGPIRPAQSGR